LTTVCSSPVVGRRDLGLGLTTFILQGILQRNLRPQPGTDAVGLVNHRSKMYNGSLIAFVMVLSMRLYAVPDRPRRSDMDTQITSTTTDSIRKNCFRWTPAAFDSAPAHPVDAKPCQHNDVSGFHAAHFYRKTLGSPLPVQSATLRRSTPSVTTPSVQAFAWPRSLQFR